VGALGDPRRQVIHDRCTLGLVEDLVVEAVVDLQRLVLGPGKGMDYPTSLGRAQPVLRSV
jgi:hypothetical protein